MQEIQEPKLIHKPKLLVGEGKEEVRFFNALLKHLKVDDVQVEDYGGKIKLSSYLKTLPLRPSFHLLETFAVVRDADENPSTAFQSVCQALQAADGLNSPEAHCRFSTGCPRVGVFVMPDGCHEGMLEDLCMNAVKNDPATVCVEKYLACIERVRTIQPRPRAKAWIHTWLASQEDPAKRLGEAAAAGYWPWASEALGELTKFLRDI